MSSAPTVRTTLPGAGLVHEMSGGPATPTAGALHAGTTMTILKFTYVLVPIVAGFDKFTNLLVHWEQYINPALLQVIPFSGQTFMGIAGVVEIAAGILTFVRPRMGAYVVMAWLIAIALSLVASGQYLDVAVRDLVMAVGALTLAGLSRAAR